MWAIISVQVESVWPFDRCSNRLFWLSYERQLYKPKLKASLGFFFFFISVRNKIEIQSLVSCSSHHYGISCLFCKQLCQMKMILLLAINHHVSCCQWKKWCALQNLVQVMSDERIHPLFCKTSWTTISGRGLEVESWLRPTKCHSQNLTPVAT